MIAFAAPAAPAHHVTYALSVVNPDGSGLRQLTHPADGVQDDQPDFSPDGRLVAFQRCGVRCALFTIRADGTGLRAVGRTCSRKPPACEDRTGPAWSPDGKRIAFVRSSGPVRRGEIAHSTLMVMRADGTGARVLRGLKAYSGDFERPTWSPDGTRLAVSISGPGSPPHGRALYVLRADGSGLRRLTAPSLLAGDHPDFSPDGSRILFGAGANAQDRGGELYSIPAGGGAPARITHSGRKGAVSAGSYSPDGTQLTFATLPPGEDFLTSLYVSNADGSGMREIAHLAAAIHPDWGP